MVKPGVEPAPISEHQLARLYKPVGTITVYWGIIDGTVTRIAFYMFMAMGTPQAATKWPMAFGARLAIVETALKRRPEFSAFAPQHLGIFKNIRHMVKLRDMLIHGMPVEYDAKRDGVIFKRIDKTTPAQRAKRPDITHRPREMLVRFSVLEEAARRCHLLIGALLALRASVRAVAFPE